MWSDGKYKEGMDYQCLIYGGKLLSNMTFDEEKVNKFINLLNVNRNAIVLMDSDKKSKGSEINKTKKRIIEECNNINITSWVTKGREIENYIPKEIIDTIHSIKTDDSFEKYQDIKDYLNSAKRSLGDLFDSNKISFAYDYIELMSLSNIKESLDLDIRMKEMIDNIKLWNK